MHPHSFSLHVASKPRQSYDDGPHRYARFIVHTVAGESYRIVRGSVAVTCATETSVIAPSVLRHKSWIVSLVMKRPIYGSGARDITVDTFDKGFVRRKDDSAACTFYRAGDPRIRRQDVEFARPNSRLESITAVVTLVAFFGYVAFLFLISES